MDADADMDTSSTSKQELLPNDSQSITDRAKRFRNNAMNCFGIASNCLEEKTLDSPVEVCSSSDDSASLLPPKLKRFEQLYPLHSMSSGGLSQEMKSQGSRTPQTAQVAIGRMSTNAIKLQIEANRKLLEDVDNVDIRLAIVKQNEALQRKLKATDDFIRTIEFEADLLTMRLELEKRMNQPKKSQTDEEVDYRSMEVAQQHCTSALQPFKVKVAADKGWSAKVSPAMTQMLLAPAMIVPTAIASHNDLNRNTSQ